VSPQKPSKKRRGDRASQAPAGPAGAPPPAAPPPPAEPPPPPRRGAGRLIALVVAAGAIVAAALYFIPRGAAFAIEPDANQNVLLVTIDTLRADAVGSYGGRAATPNLDRLADSGARFDFAHGHAVVTLPSHTSILTGRYPYEHGMRDNAGFRVHDGTATLATWLKARGLATGAFVGGFPLTKRFGLTPGFDVYDDQMPEMQGDVKFSMPERRADQVVERAVAWIGRQSGPFFSWVHVFDPHAPYEAPAPFLGQYPAQPYDGEVAFVDHALGPLFAALEAQSRPTVVIVTADHGEALGDHGELTHGMFAYEETLRVPLIVARIVPGGGATRGRVIESPARHIDIAPTVLEALGVTPDPSISGASLLGVIRDGSGPDRPSYFEAMSYNLVRGWAPLRGVLQGRQKYIDLPIVEWYDLAVDPLEQRNRAGEETTRAQVMLNLLRSFNMAPPNRPGRESAEVSAVLRSLGYVTGSAAPKDVYTEADDPKRLAEVDRDLHRATEHYQNQRHAEAIAMFESVLSRRPDMADAAIQLATAHYMAGRPGPAIKVLEDALRAGAPDRDIRIRLGLYLAESGVSPTRAIALLEDLPETDAEALNSLGVAYGRAGRFADATRTFEKLLGLDPTNGLALQNLAFVAISEAGAARDETTKAAKYGAAEGYVRQAIDADPALGKAYTTLGVILAQTGREPAAIDAWKRAVELDPLEFDALYNLTIRLARAGRLDEARRYAQQYVSTAPEAMDPQAYAQMRQVIGR
jgi:arylsulfatase A-like enzyme/Flp pilus assembly protein TadD